MFNVGDHVMLNPYVKVGNRYGCSVLLTQMAEIMKNTESVITEVIQRDPENGGNHYRLRPSDSPDLNPFYYAEEMLVAFIKVDIEKNHLLNFL